MGIRDTSYYGWKNVDVFNPVVSGQEVSASYADVAIDSSGTLFATGRIFGKNNSTFTGSLFVRKSKDCGETWETIYVSSSFGTSLNNLAVGGRNIAINSEDVIYVIGGSITDDEVLISSSDGGENWSFYNLGLGGVSEFSQMAIDSQGRIFISNPGSVVSSSDGGLTWGFEASIYGGPDAPFTAGCAIDSNDNVVIAGDGGGAAPIVYRSTDNGNTWSDITPSIGDGGNTTLWFSRAHFDSQDNLFIVSMTSSQDVHATVFSSSDNGSTWGSSSVDSGLTSHILFSVKSDNNDNIFVFGITGSYKPVKSTSNPEQTKWYANRYNGFGGAWNDSSIDIFDKGRPQNATIDQKNNNIYVVGASGGKALVRKGKLTANSSSLGPSMLNASFGYVHEEFSGSVVERFKLNNVSEFPHSSGIYQMPKMILGTINSGKIGKDEDSIIQINQIGSFVSIMFPKQDQNTPVLGFGELSAGQRIGKLTTTFEPGDFLDVKDFDHVTLYCYLLKQASGSLDDVEVKVERRPSRSTGFATEQAIEYSISGSATVATLRDIIYKKEINYGDLSIKEIGYPIDVPLTNVKDLRISARHTVGQSESNKNFIVWGRFIKSEEET